MFDPLAAASPVAHVLDRLADAIAELAALDLTRLDRDELLDLLRGVETQRRRLPVVDHRLVAEIEQRGVAGELCARDTRTLLRDVLRLSPAEAKARVDRAVDLGPRASISGEPLGPLLPAIAAAQAKGAISPEHARVVIAAIERLPAAVEAKHGAAVEARLVADALRFDPLVLARLARHVVEILDPDGTLANDADHARRRELTLLRNRDGSGRITGNLTPACFVKAQAGARLPCQTTSFRR